MLRKILMIQLGAVLAASGLMPAALAAPKDSFSLPDHASEVARGVFYLGRSVEDGLVVEGYAFEHSRRPDEARTRGNVKPPWAGGKGGTEEEADASTCYSFIARGAAWTTIEPYIFNPSNTHIGNKSTNDIDAAFGAWEAAAGSDIVGRGSTTGGDLEADTSSTDGQNEIYFAEIPDSGVLGYTIVWYTRSRGRNPGRILESDMVIDDQDWGWQHVAGIHFDGVLTHEAGHWIGMGHTNTTALCADQTMYPSIAAGDTSKNTLELGDITGIRALYAG